MNWIFMIIGLALLVKGADWFVDGSSSVAKYLKISPLVIGLTIVAFGTSAPEAAVSIVAAIQKNNEISVGNIVGSNIFNLLMVVGISATLKSVKADRSILKRDFPFNIITTAITFLLAVNLFLFKNTYYISRIDGIILLILFVFFITYTVTNAFKNKQTCEDKIQLIKKPLKYSVIISIIGIVAIISGGKLVVDSATSIALSFGISQTLIGLTIVAIGTSLPELVTSVVASAKGEDEIAMGNVIGSNIFNILFILGISSTINPINVSLNSVFDIGIMLVISLIAYGIMSYKKQVGKLSGAFFIVLYIIYTFYILMR